jgi:hypothetical protein
VMYRIPHEYAQVNLYLLFSEFNNASKWAPSHNEVASLQIAGAVDGLQNWKVAVNIMIKQSRMADKRQSFNLRVGRESNNIRHKKKKNRVFRHVAQGLGLRRFF